VSTILASRPNGAREQEKISQQSTPGRMLVVGGRLRGHDDHGNLELWNR
jgi:hypothetical protein